MDIWSLAKMMGPNLPPHSVASDMSGYGMNVEGQAPDPLDMSEYGMGVQPTSNNVNASKKGFLAMLQGLQSMAKTPVMSGRAPASTPGGMGDIKRLDDPLVSAMPGGPAVTPSPEPATAAPQSPEQQIMARLQSLQSNTINDQKSALSRLEKELGDFRDNGGEVNLAPLTGLVDTWTGSKFTNAYKQPMSAEERKLKEFGLQDMAQKQRRGIADDEMGLLKLNLMEKLATSKAQKQALGARLPASAVEKLGDGQMALDLANGLENSILEGSKLMGPAKGMGAILPYSAAQKKLVADFNLVKQKIGKAIEGGVLRKEDESKYEKILPVITDLPDVAIDKARRLSKLLNEDVNRFLTNFGKAGYNVQNFKAGAPAAAEPDGELAEAMKWLEANPNDPDAAAVREKLGV